MNRKPRILFLCQYPHGGSPGQRFRFEQYLSILEAHGYDVRQEPFMDDATRRIINQPGHMASKVTGVLRGFVRRFALLREVRDFDFVFVHLEAAPIGPPVIEAALLAMGKKVIYDIDDLIFVARTQPENRLAAPLRWRSKVAWTARHAHRVVGVNPFLVEWARQHNSEVRLIPTTIDPAHHRPRPHGTAARLPVLGWTGTRTTAPYLDVVREALDELSRTREFALRVICDRDPGFHLRHYEFVPWREETEIEDLWPIDIGLMPVANDGFSMGKVGFKAIQYSALEIPPVVSDVGSGREVVDDGVTGIVVPNETAAWVAALQRLLDDPDERQRLGKAARAKILGKYSVPAQTENFLGLFTEERTQP